MDVTFDCPYCDTPIAADTSASGGRTTCPGCHEVVLIPAAGIQPGMSLGDFKIEKCLGVGGMGEVFLANQVAMDRRVALKVLPPAVSGNKTLVDRFLQEVRMAGKLEHPNIVTAFYAGMDSGYYYLAMSYIDGEDLENRIKTRARIPEKEALRICLKVARALDYAWEKHRLLHRDIKPANIMLDRAGEVKLMDMGIAKALTEESNLTTAGVMVGTPFYMSPEQAKNVGQVDCRTDIYALGGTLFHMVTGIRPYEGPTAISVVAKHLNDPVPAAHSVCPEVSPSCGRLISLMMAKNPDRRPRDWKVLVELIEGMLAEKDSPATLQLKVTDSQQEGILAGPMLDLDEEPAPLRQPASPPEPIRTAPAPSGPGSPRPGATMADVISQLPANPTFPRSVKITLFSIAALAIVLLGTWIAHEVFALMNQQDKEALRRELEQKNLALQEKEVVGDIQAGLARAATAAELTTEEELRLKRLEEMIQVARDYERQNPAELERAIEKYRKIQEYAAGTKFELIVDDDIARLEKAGRDIARLRDGILGSWRSVRFFGDAYRPGVDDALDLRLDASGSFRMVQNRANTVTGAWTLSSGAIHLTVSDKAVTWPLTLRDNRLTLTLRQGVQVELRKL